MNATGSTNTKTVSDHGVNPERRYSPETSGLIYRISLACGLLTAALGISTLIGWLTNIPLLATFVPGTIPMAPSTALFFLGYGGAGTLFLLRTHANRQAGWAAWALGALGLLAVTLIFALSLQGIRSDIEHLGFYITGTVAGSPIGHMSPLTAFCFILAGAAFLLALPPRPRYFWPGAAAFWCAASISLFSLALLLGYLFGAPLLYGSGFIPPALPTSRPCPPPWPSFSSAWPCSLPSGPAQPSGHQGLWTAAPLRICS